MNREVVTLLLLFLNRFSTCWRSRGYEGAFETFLGSEEKTKGGEGQHSTLPLYGPKSSLKIFCESLNQQRTYKQMK